MRCEEITISGGMVRQKAKYERFLNKRSVSNPRHGAVKFRAPGRILWRTVRGMIPHKTPRGAEALGRLKSFEGVPAPYDKVRQQRWRTLLLAWGRWLAGRWGLHSEQQGLDNAPTKGRATAAEVFLSSQRGAAGWSGVVWEERSPRLGAGALSGRGPVPPAAACPQVKRMVIPDALKVLRLQHGHKNCRLGDVAASVRRGRGAGRA